MHLDCQSLIFNWPTPSVNYGMSPVVWPTSELKGLVSRPQPNGTLVDSGCILLSKPSWRAGSFARCPLFFLRGLAVRTRWCRVVELTGKMYLGLRGYKPFQENPLQISNGWRVGGDVHIGGRRMARLLDD
jgi:hypothetical protein